MLLPLSCSQPPLSTSPFQARQCRQDQIGPCMHPSPAVPFRHNNSIIAWKRRHSCDTNIAKLCYKFGHWIMEQWPSLFWIKTDLNVSAGIIMTKACFDVHRYIGCSEHKYCIWKRVTQMRTRGPNHHLETPPPPPHHPMRPWGYKNVSKS